jgi:superfamily II DNA or RNA helicase
VQTLARRKIPAADIVIIDECHISSEVINKLIDDRPDIMFIGLSATPWSKGLGLRWNDLILPISISDLIDQGYLSKFSVFAPDVPDMSCVKVSQGDYAVGESEKVMSKTAIVSSVCQTWLAHGENRPTLLFGVNCAHAKRLSEEFQAHGVATAYVDAYTDSVERSMIERKFRTGEVKIACSVRTMTTGIDWPVSCIIDAAPTKSLMLHVQKIGRGLRVNEGTEDLKVFDHAGNSLTLGLVTDINITQLDRTDPGKKHKAEKAEKLPKPCSKCEVLHIGLACPNCGHERKPIDGVETVDGDLIEITETKGPTYSEMEDFWNMAMWTASNRGYKIGWASQSHMKKFGVWPPKSYKIKTIEPDGNFKNWETSQRIRYAKSKGTKR